VHFSCASLAQFSSSCFIHLSIYLHLPILYTQVEMQDKQS
jgi:hypothetical protein